MKNLFFYSTSLFFLNSCVTWDSRLHIVNATEDSIYVLEQVSNNKIIDTTYCMDIHLEMINNGDTLYFPSQTKWKFLLKEDNKLDIYVIKKDVYENNSLC